MVRSIEIGGPTSPQDIQQQKLGDLANHSADVRVMVINRALLSVRTIWEREGVDNSIVEARANEFRQQSRTFAEYVTSPENYSQDALKTVVGKYEAASSSDQEKDMTEIAAERIAQFGKFGMIADFDGTITDGEAPIAYEEELIQKPSGTYLETLIPGSEIAEPMLAENRNNFAEVFASTWQYVLKDRAGRRILRESGRHAPIREGADKLFGYLKSQDITPIIVSANFEPFVKGGLDKIKNAEGTKVFAIRSDSLLSAEKGNILLHLAQENPDQAYVYVGDGSSDYPAIEAKDIIACYFALEGSDFAKSLEEAGLPYFTYRNLHDVQLKLREINLKADAIRNKN